MKKLSLLIALFSCISLSGMKKLVSVVRFLKPNAVLQFQAKKYSVYTDYTGFSCNNVDDVLAMYEKDGKIFIDDLYRDSYAGVNRVKGLINTELERCKDTGNSPDKELFEILDLMSVRKLQQELKDVDDDLKWSQKHVSVY